MTTIAPASDRPETLIARAAQATGADFDFLVRTAERESGFDARAQAHAIALGAPEGKAQPMGLSKPVLKEEYGAPARLTNDEILTPVAVKISRHHAPAIALAVGSGDG